MANTKPGSHSAIVVIGSFAQPIAPSIVFANAKSFFSFIPVVASSHVLVSDIRFLTYLSNEFLIAWTSLNVAFATSDCSCAVFSSSDKLEFLSLK